MAGSWPAVRERLADRTDQILSDLRAKWGIDRTVEPFEYGPWEFHPDDPPESVGEQLEILGGIASVIVFYTPARERTVLVYNPLRDAWEPPGGAIEADQTPADTARTEALEETGLTVELTDLLYTGRFELRYESGASAPLPLAQFVGHRVEGSLHVEYELVGHPGTTRATGLFDAATLPETREEGEIRRLLAGDDA